MWWQIGAAANAIIAFAYVAIALALLMPLLRPHRVPSNRLGTATVAIFFAPGDLCRRAPANVGES